MILLGQNINIYKYHKHVMQKKINNDIMLRRRLILEEYGPGIEYILGNKNIAADALSRLPNHRNQEITRESMYITEMNGGRQG